MASAASLCFSASASVTQCIKLPENAAFYSALRIGTAKGFRTPSLKAHSIEHLSVGSRPQRRWWDLKVSAAVAQDETAAVEMAEFEENVVADDDVTTTTNRNKVYFGNLPYNCDSTQLAGIIQEFASPELVEVLYDQGTGRSKGFAFVTMSTVEDCELVIKNLDGCQYGGRMMRVNFADKPRPKEPLYPESEHKLFVGNLSWSVTSETLSSVFQRYGDIVGARVLYDGESGRSRGYGFICYSSKDEMDSALEALNGVELEGRAMRVSLALGKRN